ncbi:MAG: serine/threonine-protein kinase [Sumerlaeia bacterium]
MTRSPEPFSETVVIAAHGNGAVPTCMETVLVLPGAAPPPSGVAPPGEKADDTVPEDDEAGATVIQDKPFEKPPRSSVLYDALGDRTTEIFLLSKIAQGGQGEIWEAYQKNLDRLIAVKRAHGHIGSQDDFFKEAFASARLDHPNIVPIYDLGLCYHENEKVPLLVMKRIVGTNWAEMMRTERSSPHFSLSIFLAKHLPILVSVINAVSYAHAKGVIHRDLKPSQVMVGDYGEVFLLDWGLAIFLGQEEDEVSETSYPVDLDKVWTLDTATNPAGTPAYMAPEQARFFKDQLGFHTDVYLLGAILYEMVTGRPPHHSEKVQKSLRRAIENEYEPPGPGCPAELTDLIAFCLRTDPAERPASALAVRETITAYLTGAGRKQQSISLCNQLRKRGFANLGYEELSQAARQLSEITHLWPDNPDIDACRHDLLVAYAEAAIANRDFMLARLQADRLEDDGQSAALRRKIEEEQQRALKELPRPPLFTAARLAVVGLCCLAVAFTVFGIVRTAEKTLLDEVMNKVRSIASVAASDVRAEDLRAVDAEQEIYAPAFQRVFNQLSFYRRANDDIRYIYSHRPEFSQGEDHWRTLVDIDPVDLDLNGNGVIESSERGNPPGLLYPDGTAEMLLAFEEKRPTAGILKDDWGSFISGFAPVTDQKTGEVVAIVGVDVLATDVERKARFIRRAGVVGGGLLVLLTAAAFLAYFRSLQAVRRVELLRQLIEKQNAEGTGRQLFLG